MEKSSMRKAARIGTCKYFMWYAMINIMKKDTIDNIFLTLLFLGFVNGLFSVSAGANSKKEIRVIILIIQIIKELIDTLKSK